MIGYFSFTMRCQVPGCPSRITVEYDPGEASSRDYPGSPPFYYATSGCSDEHLEMHSTDPELEHAMTMQGEYEQTLEYVRWDAGIWLAIGSRRYLQGKILAHQLPLGYDEVHERY